jgi:hypothetical protein
MVYRKFYSNAGHVQAESLLRWPRKRHERRLSGRDKIEWV